jgi:Rieske 2Fe-2S family protein
MERAPTLPASLDRSALDAVLAPFGESALLPAAAYLDPEVLAWERRQFFDAGWVCVGRADELAATGAQRAVSVGSGSVLLVRGGDGGLRAFANLCRHRGHELLACGAATSRGVVQCPYHAWTYELDGALRLAPRVGIDVDRDTLGLVPVRLHVWQGWVFVNADGAAPPFEQHAGALHDLLDPWGCAELRVGATHVYELEGNWKLACENYHECYHCPLIHPELCRVTVASSGDNYRTDPGAFVGGTMALAAGAESMSLSGRAVGRVRPGLSAAQARQVVYVQLFPNLLVALHPDYVLTHRIEPLGPASTRIECQWLFDPTDLADPQFDPRDAIELWDVTNRQDWQAVESVQRGVASPWYRPGVLAHDEDAVYQFITMVAAGYLGRPLVRGSIPTGYARQTW